MIGATAPGTRPAQRLSWQPSSAACLAAALELLRTTRAAWFESATVVHLRLTGVPAVPVTRHQGEPG